MRALISFFVFTASFQLWSHEKTVALDGAQSAISGSEWTTCIQKICGPEKDIDTHDEILERALQKAKSWEDLDGALKELADKTRSYLKDNAAITADLRKKQIERVKKVPEDAPMYPIEAAMFFWYAFFEVGEFNEASFALTEEGKSSLKREPYNFTDSQVEFFEERSKLIEQHPKLKALVSSMILGPSAFLQSYGMSHRELSDTIKKQYPLFLKKFKDVEEKSRSAKAMRLSTHAASSLKYIDGKKTLTLYEIASFIQVEFFVEMVEILMDTMKEGNPFQRKQIVARASFQEAEEYVERERRRWEAPLETIDEFSLAASDFLLAYNLGPSEDHLERLKKENPQEYWDKIRALFEGKMSKITMGQISSNPPPVIHPPSKTEVLKKFQTDLQAEIEGLEIQKESEKQGEDKSRAARLWYLFSSPDFLSENKETIIDEISSFEEIVEFSKTAAKLSVYSDYSVVTQSYSVLNDMDSYRGVLFHELAHAFSMQVSKSKRSPKSLSYWKNLRGSCLSGLHKNPEWVDEFWNKDGGSEYKENMQAEEDFADMVAAKLHKPRAINSLCGIISQEGNVYQGAFQGESPAGEPHSHRIHRLLHTQSYQEKKLPSECNSLIQKYKLQRITESACI